MSIGSSSSLSWSNQEQEPPHDEHANSNSNLLPAQLPVPAVPFHILLGRGRGAYQSEGNRRLRQMINWFLPEYRAATTSKQKMGITSKIVAFVQVQGGRFGTEDLAGKFIEAPYRQARIKVAQLVRYFRRNAVEQESSNSCLQQENGSLYSHDHPPTIMDQGDIQSFGSCDACSIMDDHTESDQVLDEVAAACLDAPQEWSGAELDLALLCEPNAQSQSGGQEQTRTALEVLLMESDRVLHALATACLDQPQQCPDTGQDDSTRP